MVTTGMDHSVFERSLIILENEHARTEDKIVACVELEGYFNNVSKTDITSQPIRNLWEKLVKILLCCLEKENTKLHASVLQALKTGIQVLPKGLGLGMQVASQCYRILQKTFQATEENTEPSYRTRVLVELFRCLSRFDDPQFVEAMTTSNGVGYAEHKVLINKCIDCKFDITENKDQQDGDLWISFLRLESLLFATRLMRLCGVLLKSHFVEDLDFWLELLLPHVFTYHESYSSTLRKDCDIDIRKTTREALKVLLELMPPDQQITLEKWPKIKKDIKDSYADKMVKLVGIVPDWAPIWCTVLDVLDGELIRKGNNHLINKLLNVEERAFKYDRTEVRVQAFICWRHLVDKFLPPCVEISSEAVQRSVRLLIQPLQPNNAKTDIMSRQKLNTWWHLVRHLETGIDKHLKSVLVPFLNYCFGSSKAKEIAPGKKFPALHIPCAQVLTYILDLEPVRQSIPEKPLDITNVEECIVHPCSVPLLSNPNLFLDVSEELFHCIGESIVILSSRNEVEVGSQLLLTIWNFLLRHVAVVQSANGIAPERVVKLIQDLLRLVQSLTERSSSAAPSLANHCISSVLENLIVGPHALPPSVLSSPSYYVGSAQLMTGTPALFLVEIMMSRPLLRHATSHSRYIPILKAILDMGIHHHKVLEFMHSVMKQLETVAGAYYNVNAVERSSLCTVWSNIAQAVTEYLKDHYSVNQGNDKHHDLSCLYMVLLFPFYHLYSISYKQTVETLEVWRELYKSFHHAALQSVLTLDMNEICETVSLKISQALTKHCPVTANQALPLLQAMQSIIMAIPFGDICRHSAKSKTKFFLLPDRGRSSKPTSYITNTMNLIVKVSQLFSMYERTGEWYNTVGSLIMNCLESLFKNMKAANVAAAVPMVSGFSDSVLSLLQASPLQDGTTKFWTESLQRMWKYYFTFIETYVPQKSVKDFLGWMSALLEVGFKHSDMEVRNITVQFWDTIVVPAFALDKTNVPQALKEAREKCIIKRNDASSIESAVAINNSSNEDGLTKAISDTLFAVPDEEERPKKSHQSLVQQLTDKGHILTKHQKEVFRRQKNDIPALYSSTLQPAQEDSVMSESSVDTSDFMAPQRIMETPTSTNEFKEPLPPSLKVLEPPTCLRRTADYRKKMMIDHEGSIVLASFGDGLDNEENAMTEPFSAEADVPQIQENAEPPVTPVSLAFVTDPVDPTGNRKLNLETVAVRLPSTVKDGSKDLPKQSEGQIFHHTEADNSIRMSLSASSPVTVSSINTPISFPLEEPTVCSDVVMGDAVEQSHDILTPSHMDVQEIVELPSSPLTILSDRTISPNNVTVVPKSSGLSGIIPESGKLLLSESCKKLTSNPLHKIMKNKPANTLTNYFKPVSITLTADEDEVEQTRKGGARTIHLSIEPVTTTTAICSGTAVDLQPSDNLSDIVPTIIESDNEILEASSMSSVEVSTTTMENVENDGSSSPVKVVVEKVEDFSLAKTYAALETMTPTFNIENEKVSPQSEVSSSSRRKTKSPLRRNPGDPKLPPFKTMTKSISESKITEQEISVEKSSMSGIKTEKKIEKEKLLRSGRKSSRGRKSKNIIRMAKVENNIDTTENNSSLNTLGDNISPSLLQVSTQRNYKPKKSNSKLSDIKEDLKAIQEVSLSPVETVVSSDDKQPIVSAKTPFIPLDVKTKKSTPDVNQESPKVLESCDIKPNTNELKEIDLVKNDSASVNNSNKIDLDKTITLQEPKKQNILSSSKDSGTSNKNEVNISESVDKQSSSIKTAISNVINNRDNNDKQADINEIIDSKSNKLDENTSSKSNKLDKETVSPESTKMTNDVTKHTPQTKFEKQEEVVYKEKNVNLPKKSRIDASSPKKDVKSLFPKVKLNPIKEKNTFQRKSGSFIDFHDSRLLRHRRSTAKLDITTTSFKGKELAIKSKLAQVVIEPCSNIADSKLSRENKSSQPVDGTTSESPKKADSADKNKVEGIVKELTVNALDQNLSKHTKSTSKFEPATTVEPVDKDNSAIQNKEAQNIPESSITLADSRQLRQRKSISKLDTTASEPVEKAKSSVQDKLADIFKASASIADPRLSRHRKSVSKVDSTSREAPDLNEPAVQDNSSVIVHDGSTSIDDPRILRQRKSVSKLDSNISKLQGKNESVVQDNTPEVIHETSASKADPKLSKQKKSVSKFDSVSSEISEKDKSAVQYKAVEVAHEASTNITDPRLSRHRKSASRVDSSSSETTEKDEAAAQEKLADGHEASANISDSRPPRHRKSAESAVQEKLADGHEVSVNIADSRLPRHKKSTSKLSSSSSETTEKDESVVQNKSIDVVPESSANVSDPRLSRHRKSVSKPDYSSLETREKEESAVQDKSIDVVPEGSANVSDPRLSRHRKSVSKPDYSSIETREKEESAVQDKSIDVVPEGSANVSDPRLSRNRKSVSKPDYSSLETREKEESAVQDKSIDVVPEGPANVSDPRLSRHRKSVSKPDYSSIETREKEESAVQDKSIDVVPEGSANVSDPRLSRHRKSVSKPDYSSIETREKEESAVQDKSIDVVPEGSANVSDPRLSRHRKSVSKPDYTSLETREKEESAAHYKSLEVVHETSVSIADPRITRQRKSLSKVDSKNSESQGKDDCVVQEKSAEVIYVASASICDTKISKHRKSVSKLDSITSELLEKDKSTIENKSAEVICKDPCSYIDSKLSRQRKSTSKFDSPTPAPIQKDQYAVENKLPELVSIADQRFSRHRRSLSKLDSTSSSSPEKDKSATDKSAEVVNEISVSIADPRFSRHRKSASQLDLTSSASPVKNESSTHKNASEQVVRDTGNEKSNSKAEKSFSFSSSIEMKDSIASKRKRIKRKIDADFISIDDSMPKERRRKLNDIERYLFKNKKNYLLTSTANISNKELGKTSKCSVEVTAKHSGANRSDVPETLEDIEKEVKALTEGSHAETFVMHGRKATCYEKESRLVEKDEVKIPRKKTRYSVLEDKTHGLKHPVNVSRNLYPAVNESNKIKDKFEKSPDTQKKIVLETQPLNSYASISQEERISKQKKPKELELKTNLDDQLSEAASEMSEMFNESNTLKKNSNKDVPKSSEKLKEMSSNTSGSKENVPPIEKTTETACDIPESMDVIESSQESTTSVSVVKRPIMHKCSVSVRRIDTILEPGSKIDMSQGDQKLMILVPEDPGSSYKLLTPEKCQADCAKLTDNSKLLSVAKSLTSKLDAVQEDIHKQSKNTSLKDQSEKEDSDDKELTSKEKNNKEDCVQAEVSVIEVMKDDTSKTKPRKKSEEKTRDSTKSDTPKQLLESEEKTKDITESDTPKPKHMPDCGEKTKDVAKSGTPKPKSKQFQESVVPEEKNIESSKSVIEDIKRSDSSVAVLETPKSRQRKGNITLKPEDNVAQEKSTSKPRNKKQDLLPDKTKISESLSLAQKSRSRVVDEINNSLTSNESPTSQSKQENTNTIIESMYKIIEKEDKTKSKLKQQDSKAKVDLTKQDTIRHRSKLDISKLDGTNSDAVVCKSIVQSEEIPVELSCDEVTLSSKDDATKLKTRHSVIEIMPTNSQNSKTMHQVNSVKTKDINKNPMKDRQKSDENNTVQEDSTKSKSKNSSSKKVAQDLKSKSESIIQDAKIEKNMKKSDNLENKSESTSLNKSMNKILINESPKKSKLKDDSSFEVRIIKENVSGNDSKISKDHETEESHDSSKTVQIKVSVALKENANPLDSLPSKRKECDISSEEMDEDRSIEMVVSKIKRIAQKAEHFIPKDAQNAHNIIAKKSQDINSTPTKLSTDTSDSEKTPSPSPTRPLLSSPSSLLKAFSSPSSGSLKLSQKSRQRRIEGRAQYMVGLAVGAREPSVQQEESEISSPVSSRGHQDMKSIMAATPLSRKRLLYNLLDDETIPTSPELERTQETDLDHETFPQTPASESRRTSDLPMKRVLKHSTGEDTPPSKKKRVWFPDPEVSGTRVFTAYEDVEDGGMGRPYPRTKMILGLRKRDRKLRVAKLRSPTTMSAKKIIRPANIVQNDIMSLSQSSPDLTGITSQGSMEDVFTELLNSQDSFFPPLVSCMHPIESIAHQLTTHVMWTKALVVELNRKGIRTVGDLSRLDEASINRLPVATPRVGHTREVLENYYKLVGQGGEKGDGHPSGESTLSVSPQSTEPAKLTTADIVRFMNSNKGSLPSLLEEVYNSGQCSDKLNQEICQMLCGRNRPSGSSSSISEDKESISELVTRFGRDTVVDYLMRADTVNLRPTHSIIHKWIMSNGVENVLAKLPQLDLARHIVKNNAEELCKVITENPTLQEKLSQNYFISQLATGQLSHKDLFDKLFAGDWNNSLLNAMQSFLMLKRSTEDILHKMPVESVMQFATSRLTLVDKIGLCIEGMMVDTSLEVPLNHYHKLVHAVAKKVSRSDFATINYKVMMELLDKD